MGCVMTYGKGASINDKYVMREPQKNRRRYFVRMREMFGELGLRQAERNRYHEEFSKIDVNKDGNISRIEFVEALGITPKALTSRMFEVMKDDDSDDGGLGFVSSPKFFLAIFHYSLRSGPALVEDFFNSYATHNVEIGWNSGATESPIEMDAMLKMFNEVVEGDFDQDLEKRLTSSFYSKKKALVTFAQFHDEDAPDPEVYKAFYKHVHAWRKKLEKQVMQSIFLQSWPRRKKEIIEILREKDCSSVGQCFMRGMKKIASQGSFSEKAFYKEIHVLDHIEHAHDDDENGNEEADANDDEEKHEYHHHHHKHHKHKQHHHHRHHTKPKEDDEEQGQDLKDDQE